MNYIKDIITENGTTTFFLQTDDEPQIWYWQVPTESVNGDYLTFVNDERNSSLGCSVAGFDTLQDAYDDYYGNTEV